MTEKSLIICLEWKGVQLIVEFVLIKGTLYGYITREFLGLRMRTFQGSIFTFSNLH